MLQPELSNNNYTSRGNSPFKTYEINANKALTSRAPSSKNIQVLIKEKYSIK